MSGKVIAIVLVLAIVITGAALALIQWSAPRGARELTPKDRSGHLAPGDRLLDFNPADVTQIVLLGPDAAAGTGDMLVRDGAGAWVVRMGSTSWPADPARVQAGLRMLSEAVAVAPVSDQASLDRVGTTIRLTLKGTDTRTVRLSAATLGGQGLAEIVPDSSRGAPILAQVRDDLHRAFAPGSLAAWRQSTLLPGVAQSAVSVRLVGPTGSAALKKISGRWMITEPINAPAGEDRVAHLLQTLERIQVTRFFDETGGAPEGVRASVESPAARVIIEHAAPAEEAARTSELRLGATVDPRGRSLAADLNAGPIVAVESAGLEQLSTEPARYLRPAASTIAKPDVGEIVLTGLPLDGSPAVSRTFRRTPTGWVEVRDGREVALTRDRAGAVEGVLIFACDYNASIITLEPPPAAGAAPTLAGSIALRSAAGSALDTLELLRAPGSPLWTKTTIGTPVYRGYESIPPMLTALMPELLGAKPATDAPTPSPADVNK